jgi:hypothetical protein
MSVTTLDSTAVVAKASGDSVTALTVGKHLSAATASHTRDYWTIERWCPDITQSEQFSDCVFTKADIKLPATGISTIDFSVIGLNSDTSASQYFTTPADVTTSACFAAVNAAAYVAGTKVAVITAMDIVIDGGSTSVGAALGANVAPDITPGKLVVMGNMTIALTDAAFRDYFRNETEVSVIAAFTTDNTAAAAVMSIIMPRVKINGAAYDDGAKAIFQTVPFKALENTGGGLTTTDSLRTTITIQDSSFV